MKRHIKPFHHKTFESAPKDFSEIKVQKQTLTVVKSIYNIFSCSTNASSKPLFLLAQIGLGFLSVPVGGIFVSFDELLVVGFLYIFMISEIDLDDLDYGWTYSDIIDVLEGGRTFLTRRGRHLCSVGFGMSSKW